MGDLQRAAVTLILQAMERRDMSTHALSVTSGITYRRLRAVLANERAMTTDELATLCDRLGLSAARLFRDAERSMGAVEAITPANRAPGATINGALAAELRAEIAAQQAKPADLAAAVGIPTSTLKRALRAERTITMDLLVALADALEVQAGTLLERARLRMQSAMA